MVARNGRKRLNTKKHEGNVGVMEIFNIMILVAVTPIALAKLFIFLKLVNFTVH